MVNVSNNGDRATKWTRWIARGIGSLVVAFWLFMGITYDIVESRPWTLEDMIMAGLVTTSALGVLIAWWREGIGGTILVICAAAHSTFAYVVAGHNKALAMLVSGGPFLLIGSLFLAVWWRSRHRR
ncbi:MAG: hypothetical protein KAW49_14395 [Anaerolineae bacterium]|nr:hypothetical protein [Anaerolineae bacterium]